MNLKDFFKKYPNDEACLQKIFTIRYGFKPLCKECNIRQKFTKIKGRPVYQCSQGHQISPLANTVFEKTTTSLQLWFYAIYLMTATRGGISAKQLQRELGVTYKTAWRMMKQIRVLMGNTEDKKLIGVVEVDESFFGGLGKTESMSRILTKNQKILLWGC